MHKQCELIMVKRKAPVVRAKFSRRNRVTIATSDCLRFLRTIPDGEAALVVTSPPYNVGKKYETQLSLDEYIAFHTKVIAECVRAVRKTGSICYVVGHTRLADKRLVPLDIILHDVFDRFGLKLRNRIIWHFEHGLNSKNRFSGRHESILWYTRSDDFTFNLDAVRVPQKYPGKRHYKGPHKGLYSGNPSGKNPGDVWKIPNVKANHVEKTTHPCQFPIGLAETLILSFSNRNDLILDPFFGVGSTAVAALRTGRRVAGCDLDRGYIEVARQRIRLALVGRLKTRPRDRQVYQPSSDSKLLTRD